MANPAYKTIPEPNKEVRVARECDVVVVGGGPGGIGAAVSAARNGANVVLIERYGHLGGMGTGGLVTIVPNLTDFEGRHHIAGLQQEWIDRIDVRGGATYPAKETWGSSDKRLTAYWNDRGFFFVRQDHVLYSVFIDAELSKCALNDMVNEAKVKTYLDSWGTMPIMEGDTAKGVIFESKSGRQAVLAKIVIDSTGDGDLLPFTRAKFDTEIDPRIRISNLSLVYWIDGVNYMKVDDFKREQPAKYLELMREILSKGGHGGYFRSNLKNQDDVMWFHPRYPCKSQIDVEELTRVEMLGREKMLLTFDFFKKYVPGFENSFIVLSSPQLGTRGARRIEGEYTLTAKDLESSEPFEDTIAIFPDVDREEASARHLNTYMPYRCLIPKNVDNMYVACRAFASDQTVNNFFNLIPHCVALGEAAGTAAAMSLKQGVNIRKVNIKVLQAQLAKQNVPLPGNPAKPPARLTSPAAVWESPKMGTTPNVAAAPRPDH